MTGTPRRAGSLNRRLLLLLIGGISLCWLIAGVFTYHLTRQQVNHLYDQDMIDFGQAALSLVDIADSVDAQPTPPGDILARSRKAIEGLPLIRREATLGYSIWYQGQRLLATRHPPSGIEAQPLGFSNLEQDGMKWRVLQIASSGADGVRIWVFEDLHYRSKTLRLLLFSALFPLLVALPLFLVLVWLGVRQGLAPLRSLIDQVHQRGAHSLHPLSLSRAPVEVHSLVNELNLLLERLQSAMEAERRLTSDAAHEIRTPLASLRTHAQVALRSSDPAAHAHGLQQVSRSVERISSLMEQILLLARLDGEELHETFSRVDLGLLAEEAIAELAPQAIDKRIELTLDNHPGSEVMGVPLWLGVMLTNLVSNALRYTPEDGRVAVSLAREDDHVVLHVRDNGPGVAPAEHTAIFTRFYRSPSVASSSGSGLGLPIVKRIVEIHHGRISLQPGLDGGGLGVYVELPATAGETD
ncbi:ATP-binding protein [Pseudomonas sp. ZM23]|uniref:histidine kinase n=1 Tax=Pseudomonas triclosanedens TaxID=2961893 RepID=A0ABY6ZYA6_9PSED|nr:ATP-binding protein [Pseudomonas triclosanedens]MCP8465399.1 ATP-binding protein [Pseudomonas triclosanedens]MCP8470661.1 ATP-binding protein [Pseudomonas triclosanedens]MCP8476698.1 ATP-binding protein [Pseudomonas triclosanedens]WAI48849.1 ATP-binding protein [Pseudomonas triclosanedens]